MQTPRTATLFLANLFKFSSVCVAVVKEVHSMMMLSSDVAPTEEAVKALLDYLVDPMLPLKPHGKDPPSLAHLQSVAKQMHAVVLLYNYYHRKQHPELCFLEYESFCKLALTLKPSLVAHMKFTHQADSTGSNDLENQLSLTEKAIRDACNISLSLHALKEVPRAEAWPIAKVSVLLIDSKKENCVLLYDSITNGVWSVIEKCLDVSNIDMEITPEGKHANKMKRMGKMMVPDEQIAESGFEQLALTAVKEVTGINQSELMVLERHVVYSLSKEKTAAYFYIMQCTSNEDIQVPIKDTVESLQGPLFKWISGSWMLTSVVEYYNMLPYAMIVSSWYSREVPENSLQKLNVSSCQKTEENCGEAISEREQVISDGLQNPSVELGNVEIKSCEMLENRCYGEANRDGDINDGNYSNAKFSCNETVVTERSETMDEEGQEREKSDESWDITHQTVKQLDSCIGEANKDGDSNDGNYNNAKFSGNETVVTEKSKTVDEEALKREQSDESWDITHQTVKQLDSCIGENCSGKDKIVADTSKRAKKEVEETEKHDLLLDIIQSAGKKSENCVDIGYIGEETLGIDNTKGLEDKVEDTEKFDTCEVTCSTPKELTNSISANSSGKATIDVDNSKGIKKVVEDTVKSDISCDNISSTVKKLSNDDSEDSEQGPTHEPQISSFPSGKREKMDEDGVIMNFDKNEDKNNNGGVPMRVYHHHKRKIPVEIDACASVGGAINVERAGTPKSNASKSRKVSENGINWIIPYKLNGTQVADSAPVCFEPNARSVGTLQATMATRDLAMTQTALGFLFSKRANLCHQQRLLKDEIALCDRNIQKILLGNEDALALKLDAIMDGCNDVFFKDKTQDEGCQHGEGHYLSQCPAGKRISDAIFNLRSPSQDLNDICGENNWIVKYSASAPDGGFVAKITVKGMDFECSCMSELISTPEAARDSAAAQMIEELRAMSGHT